MKNYFEGCKSLDEVKAAYRRLAKENHPDCGGDTATMQEINRQYAAAVENIKRTGSAADRAHAAQEVPEEFVAAVNAVVGLKGVVLELVGAWLWATGDTRQHKDALKAAGYKWASKKKAWYWHPIWAASAGSKMSLDQIRDKYGAERITSSASGPRMLNAGQQKQERQQKRKNRRSPVSGQVAMNF